MSGLCNKQRLPGNQFIKGIIIMLKKCGKLIVFFSSIFIWLLPNNSFANDILNTLRENDNVPITMQIISVTCQLAGKLVEFHDNHDHTIGFLGSIDNNGRIIGDIPKQTKYVLIYHLDPTNIDSKCKKNKDGTYSKKCEYSLVKIKDDYYLEGCVPIHPSKTKANDIT